MKDSIRVGFIGLGCRGGDLLKNDLLPMGENGVTVTAVCDSYDDRAKAGADKVQEVTGIRPFCTTDYREVVSRDDVDAVVIATAWEAHVDIAVAAMQAGKYVGLEVGGAYSIEDCWRLIRTHEETGSELMLLENCCYGKRELMVLNMVRAGLFGEIVHCEGGYCHDLRGEIANGEKNRHYRLRNYLNRNCENYPTHELGPIAKVLDIGNGNRFLSLVSVASAAKGLHAYIDDRFEEHKQKDADFKQGDVVTTVIRCAGGQTVTLTLDTTLPRAYSRRFTVRGVKGGYFEDTDSVFLDKVHEKYDWTPEKIWGNAKEYEEQYLHPLWRDYDPKGGHGGMDWILFEAFVDAAKRNAHPPIDVYDAATWMAVSALSEQSVSMGGTPVEFPDFTRGKWVLPKEKADGKFAL